MTGGLAEDTFVFGDAGASNRRVETDVIEDYQADLDVIDLLGGATVTQAQVVGDATRTDCFVKLIFFMVAFD